MSGPLWNANEETLIPQDLFICSLPRLKGTLAGLPFLVTGFKLHKPESNRQADLTFCSCGLRGKQSPKHGLRAWPRSSVGCSCYCFSGCVSGLPNGLSSPFRTMFSHGNLDAAPEERKANNAPAPKARAVSIQPRRRSRIRDFSPCHQEVSSSTGRDN